MSAPKYLTFRAIPAPGDIESEYHTSDKGPYFDVAYKDKGGHIVYPTKTFRPQKRFDSVGTAFDGTYARDEITDEMLVDMALEFIEEQELWGYKTAEWKIDKGCFDADWVQIT